jgi:hypothetical protein
VILLEIEPEKQNTKIDFYYCVVLKLLKGNNYSTKSGGKFNKEIYNRIFDLRTNLKLNFLFR